MVTDGYNGYRWLWMITMVTDETDDYKWQLGAGWVWILLGYWRWLYLLLVSVFPADEGIGAHFLERLRD